MAEDGRTRAGAAIDALAALVGHYAWLEWRTFEVTGAWAARPRRRRGGPGVVRGGGAPPRRAGDALGRAPARAGGGRRRRAGPAPLGGAGRGLGAARRPRRRGGRRGCPRLRRVCPGWRASTGPIWRRPRPCARPRWPKSWSDAGRIAAGEARSGRFVVRNLGDGIDPRRGAGRSGDGFRTGLRQLARFPCCTRILTAPLHCLRSRETPGTGACCLKRARTRPANSPALALLEG